MPRYKQDEIEQLSKVDSAYLNQFRKLAPGIQQQIIEGLRQIGADSTVAQQDRAVAMARADQLAKAAK